MDGRLTLSISVRAIQSSWGLKDGRMNQSTQLGRYSMENTFGNLSGQDGKHPNDKHPDYLPHVIEFRLCGTD